MLASREDSAPPLHTRVTISIPMPTSEFSDTLVVVQYQPVMAVDLTAALTHSSEGADLNMYSV